MSVARLQGLNQFEALGMMVSVRASSHAFQQPAKVHSCVTYSSPAFGAHVFAHSGRSQLSPE
jgi:hemolysin-activating ACP:hemolysin acyltransferase